MKVSLQQGVMVLRRHLTEGYVETVIAREKMFGKEVGVLYAEGFMSKKPVLLHADLIGGCK